MFFDRSFVLLYVLFSNSAVALGQIVIIIDGIDQLPPPPDGLPILRWLPRLLPRNVRLIFAIAKEEVKWYDAIMNWIPYRCLASPGSHTGAVGIPTRHVCGHTR